MKRNRISLATASVLLASTVTVSLAASFFTSGGTYRVPVPKDVTNSAGNSAWVLVGVPGFWNEGTSSSTSFGSGYTTIRDINLTDTLESNDSSGTVPGYSTQIAIQAITGSLTQGTDYAYLAYNPSDRPSYDPSAAMYIMYVTKPSSSAPAMKIRYDARMEGKGFQVTFNDVAGGSASIYSLTFDSARVYSNPQTPTSADLSGSSSGTLTARSGLGGSTSFIDFNVTENPDSNTTMLLASQKVSSMADGNFSTDGNRTLAYAWDATNKAWLTYDSNNTAGTNGFTTLSKGRAYWVKLEDNITGAPGLIKSAQSAAMYLQDTGSLSTFSNVTQYMTTSGWSLVSLPNAKFKETDTGMVVNVKDCSLNAACTLRLTGAYGDSTDTLLIDLNSSNWNSYATANDGITAVMINNAILAAEANGSAYLGIRAYPAGNLAGAAATPGSGYVFLTSPHKFTVGGTALNGNIVSMGGTDLNNSIKGETNTTNYGEFALAFDFNANKIKGAGYINIDIPGYTTTTIEVDLNQSTTAAQAATQILSALQSATTTSGSVLKQDFNVTMIDGDFSGGYKTVVLASKAKGKRPIMDSGGASVSATSSRFYVRDATFVKAFDVNATSGSTATVTATVKGKVPSGSSTPNTVSVTASGTANSDICQRLADDINLTANYASTEVNASCPTSGNGNRLYIATHIRAAGTIGNRLFDLLESNASGNQLNDVTAASTQAASTPGLGTIGKVYKVSALADPGTFAGAATDGNFSSGPTALVSDLAYNPVWAPDFPESGPLYSLKSAGFNPLQFATADTNSTGQVTWHTLDVATAPDRWAELYDMLWSDSRKGYWIKTSGSVTNPLAVGSATITSANVITHYNNDLNTTSNYLDLTSSLPITETNPTLVGYRHNIKMTVGGSNNYMISSGGSNTFTARIDPWQLNTFVEQSTPWAATYAISDGVGSSASVSQAVPYVKPGTPTVTQTATGLTLTANDTNTSVVSTKAFRVYHTYINESNANLNPTTTGTTSGSLLQEINATGGTGTFTNSSYTSVFVFPTATASTTAGGIILRTVAVGTPVIASSQSGYSTAYGLISDQGTAVKVVPTHGPTNDSLGTDTLSVTSTTVPTSMPYRRDANGTNVGTQTIDSGVQITSAGDSLRMSYKYTSPAVTLSQEVPLKAWVKSSAGTVLAQIDFVRALSGAYFYLYDVTTSTLYYGTFPSEVGVTGLTAYSSSASALALTTISDSSSTVRADGL